jgi:hypothetical protein
VSEAEDEHQAVANQLQRLINQQAAEGWKFVGLEKTEMFTQTPGQAGCFGILGPAQSSVITHFDVAVFEK